MAPGAYIEDVKMGDVGYDITDGIADAGKRVAQGMIQEM